VRIAHLADAHLGFRQFQRLAPDGTNQREADVAAAFRRAIDAVIARGVDAVVIAGDLFHAVRPTNRSIIEAFTQLSRLRAALPHAPVILIAGNHDTPRSAEAGSILKLMASLGVDVVDEATKRLDYRELGLSLLAVPHAALLRETAHDWRPFPGARFNVLVLHPEIDGYFPDHGESDYGAVQVNRRDIPPDWDYVALGHYHVASEIAPRIWYSGSLEYTSPNIWGERWEEYERGVTKGINIVDLSSGAIERIALPPTRQVNDLPSLDASGMTPQQLDAAIQGRIAGLAGGVVETVTRLVVWNVPRPMAHALDHGALRALRASALHFQLDLRRPETVRSAGMGAPGASKQPLAEVVADYLRRRPLDADLDRGQFVALGGEYLELVDREQAEARA
jgi:exonuclease SbcD